MPKVTPLDSVILDDDYELFNTGDLYNKRGLKMKGIAFNGHIVQVRFRSPGKTQRYAGLGALVLTNFGSPKPFPKAQCRHKDGNPWNNHIDNLEWGTAKQNSDDKKRHGTHPKQIASRKKKS